MTASERFHLAAAAIWDQCLQHPFVRGLGDGSLPLEKFQYFMLQDYLYLFDYAKVFALGMTKARDPQLMEDFAKNIHAILFGEMDLHRSYMKRLGISEEEVRHVSPALDALSYTHYMLAVAASGGPREIIASILACSWSYAEIGKSLAKLPGALDHPFYGDWIRGYTSKDYVETNAALIARMDQLAEGASEADLAHLSDIFVHCSRYELGFWDMAWELKR